MVLSKEYIDMEITSSSYSSDFFCNYSINCSPTRKTCRELLEFQSDFQIHSERKLPTLPANELFYKGKLLPLHQKLPSESRDNVISPLESRRQSQDEYFFEWSIEFDDDLSFMGDDASKKLSWAKKMKKFSLTRKIKASREYFKLLFNKTSCSNATTQLENISKRKNCSTRSVNSVSKRRNNSCSSISSSGSSSFSFSSSSSGFNDIQSLRRRIGLNSENENSIEGAIAHCKESRLTRACSSGSRISSFGDIYGRSGLCSI
ncbi:hypothetical protein ACFE04_003102 [Oxalis oulophora]